MLLDFFFCFCSCAMYEEIFFACIGPVVVSSPPGRMENGFVEAKVDIDFLCHLGLAFIG